MGRGANAYCASKGGVNTLTKQLALEWADRGIRVNAIAPCQFMTPGLKTVMAKPQFDPKKLMQTWVSNIPLGRVGEPEEIVGPALFLGFARILHGDWRDSSGGRRLSRAMKIEITSPEVRVSRVRHSSADHQLKQLVQIGIVVADLDQTTRLLTSLFGIGPFRLVEWPEPSGIQISVSRCRKKRFASTGLRSVGRC